METVFYILLIAFCVVTPIWVTIYNICALWHPWATLEKRGKRCVFTLVTLTAGAALSWLWALFAGVTDKPWYEPVIIDGLSNEVHELIASECGAWLWITMLLCGIAMIVMQCTLSMRRPPLVSALLIAMVMLGDVLALCYVLQTWIHGFDEMLMVITWVFPLNVYLISVRLLRDEAAAQLSHMKEDDVPETGLNGHIARLLRMPCGWLLLGLVGMVPLIGVLMIVLVLTGQGPAAMVKAFTDTAEWTFSQQTPPPPEVYDGHYLCTVAAGGHRKLVKPTRMGLRRGERIIVNRQLCIANAFEDWLEDTAPGVHRVIRRAYDRYGYPISRHITTPLRADVVYVLMKPLEWAFLLTLYLFDLRPESRIAVQYTGQKYRKIQ